MNKKGIELSTSAIVVFVLALLVFVIMVYVLSSQIQSKSKSYTNITDTFEKSISKCEDFFSGRKCLPLEKCKDMNNLGSDWKDCQAKSKDKVLYCCKP
ncbi:hypothetical protein GF358_00805 [Candidatus Woesearchaeota archaeon]|nr:hypothetical protein [Candidatus Woesearchaeota archaeon]